MTYILMVKKDGKVGYGSQPYQVNGKTRIDFYPANSLMSVPWQYMTRHEAEMMYKLWQKNFPADASDCVHEILPMGE